MKIQDLVSDWQRAGIEPGDVVLVHTSMARTIRRIGVNRDARHSMEQLLQSFLDAVGTRGTLLFPLFNFGFANGEPFDIRRTPSRMGVLTEAARNHSESVRTGHPIYSFAVIGARSADFQSCDNKSAYGGDSPFGLLRTMDGKIASLDLDDQKSMTFYHHVEEMHEVPYRYMKTFRGPYTSWDGVTEEREYTLYVRDLQRGIETYVNPAGELLWKRGLYHGYRPQQGPGLRVVDANAMYEFVSQVITSGRAEGLLYRVAPSATEMSKG